MADERKPQAREGKPVLRVGLFTAWAASSGLLLSLVVLVAGWSLRQIEDRARSRARDDATHRIEMIRNRLQEEALTRPGATLDQVVRVARWVNVVLTRQATTGTNIVWIAIVAPDGMVLARSGDSDTFRESSLKSSGVPSTAGALGPAVGSTLADGDFVRYTTRVVTDGRELGTVQIGLSIQGLDATVAELLRPVQRAFLILGFVCFVMLLLGGVVLRHLLQRERILDREAAQQKHLAAMGALARRMVHEIRNPLNAMRMQIAVIQDMLADSNVAVESVRTDQLGRLDAEVTRLEKLAKSFLAFGRPPKDEAEVFSLADMLHDVAAFIRPAFERIGARVDVEIEQRGESLSVRMDKSKLREVLLNLTENAREAMDGGRLTLRLARRSGREIFIQVADTGRGISESDLPRVFEGLRSSKTDGSGLGLLIVKRIVENAGGAIHVESQVGRGTCFQIILPLACDGRDAPGEDANEQRRELS